MTEQRLTRIQLGGSLGECFYLVQQGDEAWIETERDNGRTTRSTIANWTKRQNPIFAETINKHLKLDAKTRKGRR